MKSDLRFALSQFIKSPGFTLVVVMTLALGIGANTAIFSLVDALLLKPLPYPDSERLVQVWEAPLSGGTAITSGGVFMDWEDHTTQLESIAALHQIDRNLTGVGEPVRVTAGEVTADYLKVLRVTPVLGRGFTKQDDAPDGDRHVAVISHELWQTRFQGDPSLLGRTIRLDSENYTVIGVLPSGALLNNSLAVLTPATIRADAWKQSRDYNYVCAVIGRLKPGATTQQAAAELMAAKLGLMSAYPIFKAAWGVSLQSLQQATFGNTRPYVLTLLAAVGAVLLIACANVANLLLAKASSRQSEIAVRVALGATPIRIFRQLLTESMLLALVGGLTGFLLGTLAIKPLIVFTGVQPAFGLSISPDVRVLGFALAATVITGLLFGVLPALGLAKADLHGALKDGGRGSSVGARGKAQTLLIVSETALTVVLLVSAGLLLRSFFKAVNSDPGFKRENALVFELSQPSAKAPTAGHRVRFVRAVLDRIQQLPGVVAVGMASSTPMNGSSYFGDLVSREEQPETRNDLSAGFDGVSGDFFAAMGIPLLRGRGLTDADNDESAPKVMVINDTLARRLYGEENPLGRQLHFKNDVWEVVGVIGSVRRFQMDVEATPQIYIPQVYFPWQTSIVVRTQVPPMLLGGDIRRAVQGLDAEVPIANLRTLEQSVGNSLRGRRVILDLLGLFAIAALILACIGIYGVASFAVVQRTREMGIRLALGAGTQSVIRLVLYDALKFVVVGLGLGLFGSVWANRLIAHQLYGTAPTDYLVLAAVAGLLLLVAAVACWLPALRATRVDPIIALRAD